MRKSRHCPSLFKKMQWSNQEQKRSMNAKYGKVKHVLTRHVFAYGQKKVSSDLQRLSVALRKRLKESFTIFYLRRFLRNKSYRWSFFETFLECSLPSTVSKNKIKITGHHSRLRDVMGQSYLICARTRANHARYSSVHVTFCGSSKHSS